MTDKFLNDDGTNHLVAELYAELKTLKQRINQLEDNEMNPAFIAEAYHIHTESGYLPKTLSIKLKQPFTPTKDIKEILVFESGGVNVTGAYNGVQLIHKDQGEVACNSNNTAFTIAGTSQKYIHVNDPMIQKTILEGKLGNVITATLIYLYMNTTNGNLTTMSNTGRNTLNLFFVEER